LTQSPLVLIRRPIRCQAFDSGASTQQNRLQFIAIYDIIPATSEGKIPTIKIIIWSAILVGGTNNQQPKQQPAIFSQISATFPALVGTGY
jgi:hypothetical protein